MANYTQDYYSMFEKKGKERVKKVKKERVKKVKKEKVYKVRVRANNHSFSLECCNIYEALKALMDARDCFGLEIDPVEMMEDLVKIKNGAIIKYRNYQFNIKVKEDKEDIEDADQHTTEA